jgi:selenocysteine lyase/cysteine desulfurase
VRHSLEWVTIAQQQGFEVLLDAAAYAPTNKLDLSRVHPDFVTISWYKVFGYPTGVGCLIARRASLERLRRPWFSGGTIRAVSVQGDWHTMAPDAAAFEDGTVNFLAIPDVEVGLQWLRGLGLDTVNKRVRILTDWLLYRLGGLVHGNGAAMARIYGPRTIESRGGTVALNFLDPAGRIVDGRVVEQEAAKARISLRTGCFCNPGAGELAFGIGRAALRGRTGLRMRNFENYLKTLNLPSGGAVRVSLGLVSNVLDVERLIRFAERTFRDRPVVDYGLLPPRERC